MHDVIVIGGGAAGMSAAVSLLSKGCAVLLIAETLGGKAGAQQRIHADHADEYIAGAEVTSMLARQINAHAAQVVRDQVVGVAKERNVFTITTARSGMQTASTVILATGVTPVPLDVPGAAQFAGYGIGYSATTHAPLLVGKRVAIVGTTLRALRGVHELAQTAEHVFVLAPERGQLLSPLGIALPYRANVDVYEGARVLAVAGTTSVDHIVIDYDNRQQQLAVDAVFVDLGLQPNTRMLRRIAAQDGDGFVRVDDQRATSLSGLFAAGDATSAPSEHILIAIGDGARAAISAYEYMLAHPSLRAMRAPRSDAGQEQSGGTA